MARRRTRRQRLTRVGGVLIALGVSVWVVYGLVWLAGGDPEVGVYLPFHLGGVVPGAILTRWPVREGPATEG